MIIIRDMRSLNLQDLRDQITNLYTLLTQKPDKTDLDDLKSQLRNEVFAEIEKLKTKIDALKQQWTPLIEDNRDNINKMINKVIYN